MKSSTHLDVSVSNFPAYRGRRLRRTEGLRRLVRETRVATDDLVLPLFVVPGKDVERPVTSMPGVFQHSVDRVVQVCREARGLGIPAVILFGIPERKDGRASGAYDQEGIVQRALRAIRETVPDLVLITDVCCCEYTDHGHCGIVRGEHVDNDATLPLLARIAVSHVQAGADVVAPSDMMDGRIGAIRRALDENGAPETPIIAYAAKFASAFYGPFRDAAESTPQFGDRRAYQMDPANGDEALREIGLDIGEGADIVMVKPALAYLDIIRRAKDRFGCPVAAYNVSGEYAMVKAAAANGWVDEARVVDETLTAIRRAGASIILTYFARDVARRLGH
jgi:porphobilinogen synthase